MKVNKIEILNNICYTELVYGRINKKLRVDYAKPEIEKLIFNTINETAEKFIQKVGKNYYITNTNKNIRITINSYTHRVITVDRITK